MYVYFVCTVLYCTVLYIYSVHRVTWFEPYDKSLEVRPLSNVSHYLFALIHVSPLTSHANTGLAYCTVAK